MPVPTEIPCRYGSEKNPPRQGQIATDIKKMGEIARVSEVHTKSV